MATIQTVTGPIDSAAAQNARAKRTPAQGAGSTQAVTAQMKNAIALTRGGRIDAGAVQLNAALGLLLEVGIDNIASDLTAKRAWLVEALQAKGYEVFHPEVASGITSSWREDTDMKALGEKLAAENIVASMRGDRSGQDYLRFSPHFYNTQSELERAVELL